MSSLSDASTSESNPTRIDTVLPPGAGGWQGTRSPLHDDLLFAYRKAKADVFLTDYLSRQEIASYEENLWNELQQLAQKISDVSRLPPETLFSEENVDGKTAFQYQKNCLPNSYPKWFEEIVGEPSYVFKKAEGWESKDEPRVHRFSSRHLREDKDQDPQNPPCADMREGVEEADPDERKLVLRPVCVGSMDLHVLSALWILRVGAKFDAELSGSVYSNRVRRSYDKKHVNSFALGSLEPYLNNYRRWKEDGVDAVERLIKENKDAFFVSADLTNYFHNIDPNFLLDSGWLANRKTNLFPGDGTVGEDLAIHILLVEAFATWSESLGKKIGKANKVGGLPVGVSASNVIGNIALMDFDSAVERGIKPRFYGRYVDDIALVIEGHSEIETVQNLGKWIQHHLTLFPTGHCDSQAGDVELVLCDEVARDSQNADVDGEKDSAEKSSRAPEEPDSKVTPNTEESPSSGTEETPITQVDKGDESGDEADKGGNRGAEIKVPYQAGSKFILNPNKLSLVHAEGKFGQWAVNHVRSVMMKNTSEWRNMPVLPEDPVEVATQIIALMYEQPTKDAEFFGLETIATKRAGFALKVRDLKTIARNVATVDWKAHREQFVTSFLHHTSRPSRFTEFHNYYQRLFRLCLEVGDTGGAQRIAFSLCEVMQRMQNCKTVVEVAGRTIGDEEPNILRAWREIAYAKFADEVISVPGSLVSAAHKRALLKTLDGLLDENISNDADGDSRAEKRVNSFSARWFAAGEMDEDQTKKFYEGKFHRLFSMDLALVPFKQVLVSRELDHFAAGTPAKFDKQHFAFLDGCKTKEGEVPSAFERLLGESTWKLFKLLNAVGARFSFEALEEYLKQGLADKAPKYEDRTLTVRGFVFPTRPPSPIELFAWTRVAGADGKGPWKKCEITMRHVQDWFLIARGFAERSDIFADLPVKDRDRWERLQETMQKELAQKAGVPWHGSNGADIWFPSTERDQSKINVAIGALYTPKEYLDESVLRNPQIGLKRWNTTAELVNSVMAEGNADYFVLHEACLPPTWFMTAASHLRRKNINLISGVEYLHGADSVVHNQVWFSAIHKGFRFPSLGLYIQDKQRPAHGEADNLNHIDGLKLRPKVKWEGDSKPPLVAHGNFYFAMLVCSELTNSEYRNSLRGDIDALFVVEWNQDLNTFNSLVEASALDIHSYIVQVNNRMYGDSRIRVPARESFKRDMVQIRGGINEHFVVGELDIQKLRDFQKKAYVEEGEFKPLPDGFEMGAHRRK